MINEMPIGAWATVQFNDETLTKDVYVSFGEYDEVNEVDSYGVDDNSIFYYFENVKELVEWDTSNNDFAVLEYEFVFETMWTVKVGQ